MSPDSSPQVAFCPRCLCPLNIREGYAVNFCLPAQPPFPPSQHPAAHVTTQLPPPPVHHHHDIPAPPYEPPSSSQPSEPRQDSAAPGESRRSSASSSTSFDSVFTQFSFNAEFVAELQAVEDMHFSQQPFQASSPPPPATSSPPTESSQTLASSPTSSPTTESSLVLTELDEPASTMRRWVVFRGRTPGIYTSSTEATGQTDGFPHAFMLAFDDPAAADAAYERFREDGTIPGHGHGPWVVFVGRQSGVFTSYEELCASVNGFPNNRYRCCESIEEGRQALRAFLASRAAEISPATATQTVLGTPHLEHGSDAVASSDDSWWCCFAGAQPGVYHGLARLIQAAPAEGGVRRVGSEEEGWNLWTTYLTGGKVTVISRT